MSMRSIEQAEVAGKRVLVRVDFNVPLADGEITDDTRIRAALPTIRHLIDQGARVILVSHLGRPKGKRDPALSLAPAAKRLGDLLGREVATTTAVVGPEATSAVDKLAPGDVLLLENVRFEPGEETNAPELARELAALADLFVNDAFGAAHRAHASTVGVAALLPGYAGLLLQREVDELSRLLHEPARPFVAILGGAKVSDKLAVVANLIPLVDALLIGGGMANTFLFARGVEIGESLAERDRVDDATRMLTAAAASSVAVHLPIDAVVAKSLDQDGHLVSIDKVPADEAIFDIGPDTAAVFERTIGTAATIFWNGPMGVFERPPFAAGTRAIAQAVAATEAYSVIGGGDSVAAVEQAGLADRISHISTGGGASLELLEGRVLPGVAAIAETGS